MNLPVTFTDKMKELLGNEYDEYIACYDETRLYGLRVNTKKICVEEFKKICPFEIEPIPWIENGFYYDGENVQAAKHPYYFAGLYYLQEPSAMTPANRLPVEPGDKVLDVCAAPGGKATELGAKLKGDGVLIANDISNSRAKGLLKNIEVFGIGNVLVLSEEPGKLEEYFPEYFDKILIDAPCSGEGMFRKDKKMVKAWEEHGPAFFAKIQRSIVTQAARMLKPGGMMLYSTCTFDPEENEGTIEYLMQQYPEFEIKEIRPYEGFACGKPEVTESKDESFTKTVRIWPHKMHGEGHYVALLQKGEKTEAKALKPSKNKVKKVPVTGILTDIGTEELAHLEMVCAMVHQLTRNLTEKQIEESGFDKYFVDHTNSVFPIAAAGIPWRAEYIQSKGDVLADLHEDLAAEEKAH